MPIFPRPGCFSAVSFLSILALLFMRFAGRYAALLFIQPDDTSLLALSIAGMSIFVFSYLTGWIDMCFSSYFTALEQPVRSFLTSFFGTLVFPILFLVILTPIWRLDGIWLTSVAAGAASAVLTLAAASEMNPQK